MSSHPRSQSRPCNLSIMAGATVLTDIELGCGVGHVFGRYSLRREFVRITSAAKSSFISSCSDRKISSDFSGIPWFHHKHLCSGGLWERFVHNTWAPEAAIPPLVHVRTRSLISLEIPSDTTLVGSDDSQVTTVCYRSGTRDLPGHQVCCHDRTCF